MKHILEQEDAIANLTRTLLRYINDIAGEPKGCTAKQKLSTVYVGQSVAV